MRRSRDSHGKYGGAVVVAAIAMLVGSCSSSSSSGQPSPHLVVQPSSGPTTATLPPNHRQIVTGILSEVLSGLRTANSVPRHATLQQSAHIIQRASRQMASAGTGLTPGPAGVPPTVTGPIAARVGQLSGLFQQAASCLSVQAPKKHPDAASCLPPLRHAEAGDTKFAHQLIKLSAYGSESPQAFEKSLVRALGGLVAP